MSATSHRGLALLLFAELLFCAGGPRAETAADAAPTTFVLVRHAEKGAEGEDPSLTGKGKARAVALARSLADSGIVAIYCSQYRRTCETVAPIAEHLDLEFTVSPIEGSPEAWAATFARKTVELHDGEVVLVAGHSNTVPALIEALGAAPPTIDHGDYDDLFIVSRPARGEAKLLRLHFGEPNSP